MLRIWGGIVLLLLLSACQPAPYGQNIAPEFQPYYAEFIKEAQFFGTEPAVDNLSIQFGEPEGDGFSGYCHWQDHKGFNARGQMVEWRERSIVIRHSIWDPDSDLGRQSLLNHELGHCSYMRDHADATSTQIDSSQSVLPITLMNSHNLWSFMTADVLAKNWFYYLRELHTGNSDVGNLKVLPFATPSIQPPPGPATASVAPTTTPATTSSASPSANSTAPLPSKPTN